jgi:hypothetical protein
MKLLKLGIATSLTMLMASCLLPGARSAGVINCVWGCTRPWNEPNCIPLSNGKYQHWFYNPHSVGAYIENPFWCRVSTTYDDINCTIPSDPPFGVREVDEYKCAL